MGWRIGIVVLATVYGVGFAFAGNSVMDRLPEERYPYEAGFKTRVGGKYPMERVGLRRLDPRAPFLSSVQVSPFNRIQTGDRIHIVIHRGWLGLDWYTADSRAK